jgi:hypothetical protein
LKGAIGYRRSAVGITAAALILAAGNAAATSLAVIRTEKEIVIAADSRVTNLRNDTSLPDVCKVRQTGNAIAAFVGFVSAGVSMGRDSYNAMDVVDTVLDEKGMLAEKAEKIQAILGSQLKKVLRAVPSAALADLHGFVLGVVIAGEDEQEPILKLHYIRFSLAPDGTLQSNLALCPGAGCPNGSSIRIVAPPARNLGPATEGVRWARGYVQSQIARDVPTIGGPLQLVRITHQGLQWMDQPLICSK